MQTETIAEQLFFVTVRLIARDATGKMWTGTGFVYAVETDRGTAHFLVTNRHVLAGAVELEVNMIRANRAGTGPSLGHGSQITIRDFGPTIWEGHPNNAVDVAAMPLSSVMNAMLEIDAAPFCKQVSKDICLTDEVAAGLDAVEDVFFVGYPSGLYDTANLLPIMRRGMTATPIAVDYGGVPSFLIDAAVFPGSSGSPVFWMSQGVQRPRSGGLVIGRPRVILLGVVAAVHVRSVTASVIELPATYLAEFQQPIGLGIVYKASLIEDCVLPQMERAGLHAAGVAGSLGTVPEISEADEQLADRDDSTRES